MGWEGLVDLKGGQVVGCGLLSVVAVFLSL
jgi:hypothetical protein